MAAQLELLTPRPKAPAPARPSFVHVADVHLGLGEEGSERFHDYGDALAAAALHAVRARASCFLVAGDLFDRRDISAATLTLAKRALTPLREARIPAYAIEGNHDRARDGSVSSWVRYLADEEVLYTLAPEWEDGRFVLAPHDRRHNRGAIARVGGMALVGLGFLGNRAEEALAQVAEQLPTDVPTVLLVHAAVQEAIALPMGSVRGETLAALSPRPAYVALGHGHYRYAWPSQQPLAWNPGSLEYVRVNDVRQPERGFYHVMLGPTPDVAFVRTEKRPILRVKVDLTPLTLAEEVPAAAAEAARAVRTGKTRPIVQVTLTGLARFGRYRIGLDAIHDAVTDAVSALEVRIELKLDGDGAGALDEVAALDLAALRHDVLGELLRGSQVVPETGVEPLIGLIERWREDGTLERPLDRDGAEADEVAGALYGLLYPEAGDFAS